MTGTGEHPQVEAGLITVEAPFSLEKAGPLSGLQIGYEMVGPPGAPVLLVMGGISASRHVASNQQDRRHGWWEDFAGPDRALDTSRFRVLCMDFLGGNGLTSGARSDPPCHGPVTPADQAHAFALLLKELKIPRAAAFFGSSYGGMVALQFGRLYPDRVQRLVVVGAAHRAPSIAMALRTVQREIVRETTRLGSAAAGLRLARAIGMVTYRSAAEFEQRFSRAAEITEQGVRFEVEDYLFSRGDVFAETFHPDAFLCLSESIDLQDMAPEAISVPADLVSFDNDFVAPPALMREMADRLGGPVEVREFESIFGHDAFLKERALLEPEFKRILASVES